jgi:hypothetical protein
MKTVGFLHHVRPIMRFVLARVMLRPTKKNSDGYINASNVQVNGLFVGLDLLF